eukprot:955617_1
MPSAFGALGHQEVDAGRDSISRVFHTSTDGADQNAVALELTRCLLIWESEAAHKHLDTALHNDRCISGRILPAPPSPCISKSTPNGAPAHCSRTSMRTLASRSVPPCMEVCMPSTPIPPALLTAPTSSGHVAPAIPASMIGFSIPSKRVRAVSIRFDMLLEKSSVRSVASQGYSVTGTDG